MLSAKTPNTSIERDVQGLSPSASCQTLGNKTMSSFSDSKAISGYAENATFDDPTERLVKQLEQG